MMHHVDARMNGVLAQSFEVMRYDAEQRCIVTQSHDDQEETFAFAAKLEGHAWQIDGETMRFKGAFDESETNLSGTWEQCSLDGEWKPWLDIVLSRVT